jgi:hypothetical protein
MMAAAAPPEEIVELIIRFTASIADLPLTIEHPYTTTTLSLKQRIREHLPTDLSSNRLRLIHAGKVLPDTSPLSTSLNLTSRVPPPPPSSKAKGKEPVRENGPGPPTIRIYIHCSIGDTLTPSELSSEAATAKALEEQLIRSVSRSRRKSSSAGTLAEAASGWLRASGLSALTPSTSANASSTTTPAPRGFDRLASAGLSQNDIQGLRNTFRAHLAHTHTPDTMPHGSALLALEDRWLDNSADEGMAGAGISDDDGEGSALDDMLWGNVIGFFWPLGAIVWGFREEGVWTRRKAIAVFTGVMINLVFGFARISS